jgi:hypothetical protein
MNKPVLFIVDDDPQVLAAVRRDLRSRFRAGAMNRVASAVGEGFWLIGCEIGRSRSLDAVLQLLG